MAPPPPSDATNLAELDLADRARAGDGAALGELYRRLSGGLCRHAARMLHDEAAARDVVQEAFLRALTSIAQTRPELHFRAWVYRITINLCLRELTARVRAVPDDVERRSAPPEGSAPDRGELQRGRARAVEAALAALPERQRQLLLLREVEELRYEELAEVLGLSLANVKVSLHRARTRFAAELLSRQLLANHAELEVACEEGQRLRERGAERDLSRHLEACERCRRGARSALSERFALTPPVPLAPPASWPPASSGGAPGTEAATASASAPAPVALGAGAGLAAGWVVALVAGVLLAAGAATAALLARPRAEVTTRAPAPRALHRAPAEERSPPAEHAAAVAGGVRARPAVEPSPRRAPRAAAGKRTLARERPRARVSAPPQVGDPEDAP